MARKLGVELEVVEELPLKPVGEKHKIILMMTKGLFHAYVQFSKKSNLVFTWSQLYDALTPKKIYQKT